MGSTGSSLPEHPRFSPGTRKARNYLKDVWIAFQAICSVSIASFINISSLVPVAYYWGAPQIIVQNTEFVLPCISITNASALFSALSQVELTVFPYFISVQFFGGLLFVNLYKLGKFQRYIIHVFVKSLFAGLIRQITNYSYKETARLNTHIFGCLLQITQY